MGLLDRSARKRAASLAGLRPKSLSVVAVGSALVDPRPPAAVAVADSGLVFALPSIGMALVYPWDSIDEVKFRDYGMGVVEVSATHSTDGVVRVVLDGVTEDVKADSPDAGALDYTVMVAGQVEVSPAAAQRLRQGIGKRARISTA